MLVTTRMKPLEVKLGYVSNAILRCRYTHKSFIIHLFLRCVVEHVRGQNDVD